MKFWTQRRPKFKWIVKNAIVTAAFGAEVVEYLISYSTDQIFSDSFKSPLYPLFSWITWVKDCILICWRQWIRSYVKGLRR